MKVNIIYDEQHNILIKEFQRILNEYEEILLTELRKRSIIGYGYANGEYISRVFENDSQRKLIMDQIEKVIHHAVPVKIELIEEK